MSTSKYKPYPEYKESEMKWQSSIPKKWKKVRLRFLGKTYGGLTGKKGEDFSKENSPNLKPYIPYTNILNQTYISKNHFDYVFIDEGEKQNLAKAGDLFFLMSSESYQDLGKSSILIDDIDELYLNSFCRGFRISESMIDPLFLNYQLQGHLHKQLISTKGKGFTRINLSQERLLDTPIFIPTLSEQEQITNFLDKKIPTINHTIEQLENTLSIIEEKRSSLITQVVTKGLNPDVKMMDSEIEWIEQYPTHWMRSRIRKASSRVTDGAHVSPDESSRDIPFVSIIDITNGIIDFENSLRTSAESFVQHKKHNSCPKPCDVLFSKDGTIGVTAVISEKIDFVVSSSLVIISPITDLVDSKYLDYWLRSNPIMEMVERVMSGSALRRISVRKVGDLPILLPPVQEQLEIVEYLDTNVSNIENAIKFIVQKIYTLNEYRSALISAAVTGKIDVREL